MEISATPAAVPSLPTMPAPNNPTTMSSDEQQIPEDAVLFGTLSAELADEWSDRVEAALTRHGSTMPLMQQPERSLKFIEHLRPKYWRSIDVAEVYAGRTLFSVASYPPKRRARIVEAFLQKDATVLQDITMKQQPQQYTDDDDDDDVEMTEEVTPAQLQALQEESVALRQRLQHAKRSRAAAQQALAQAKAAAQLPSCAEEQPDRTAALVEGVRGLQQTQERGMDLVQQLEDLQKQRTVAEQEDAEHVTVVPLKRKQAPKKSIFEQFEEDQQTLGTTQDVVLLQDMLQKK
jgi:hypothetical protein